MQERSRVIRTRAPNGATRIYVSLPPAVACKLQADASDSMRSASSLAALIITRYYEAAAAEVGQPPAEEGTCA